MSLHTMRVIESRSPNEALVQTSRFDKLASALMVLVAAVGVYFFWGRQIWERGKHTWEWYPANRTAIVRAVRGNAVYMNDGTVWKMRTQPYFLEGDKVHYRYSEPDALKVAFPAEFQEAEKKEEDFLRGLKIPAPPPGAVLEHPQRPKAQGFPFLFYGCALEDKTNGWSDLGYRITSRSLKESCPAE